MRPQLGTPGVILALVIAASVAGSRPAAGSSTDELQGSVCSDPSLGGEAPSDADLFSPAFALPSDAAEGVPEAAEQAETPPGLFKMALADTVHVLSAPIHWNAREWLLAAASIGTIAALAELGDVHLRQAVLKNQSGVLDDLTKVVEPFGQEYGWAVIGAYGVVGFVFHDRDAQDIAFDAAMSGLLSGGITDGLKIIVGRARPEQGLGAAHFDPFGGDKSLPSGHATLAFSIGAVIAAHSDQAWVKVSAYSIASLVAFSRVYHDAHWSSDVAAGALIGTVVGETVVRFNRTLRAGGTRIAAYAAPLYGEGRRGAVLVVVF